MSDFLARTAARAVGAAPLVRPRPTPPFEERETRSLEIVEELVTAPPLPPEGRPGPAAAAPTPAAAQAAPPAAADTPARAGGPPPPPRATESPFGAGRGAAPADRPAPTSLSGPPPGGERLAPVAARRGADAARGAAAEEAATRVATRVPAAAAVAVAPAAVPREQARAPRVAPVGSAGQEEPLSVRVHIGRLEVRANLQAAPPTPPRPLIPEAQEARLSLSDYLRGRREGP